MIYTGYIYPELCDSICVCVYMCACARVCVCGVWGGVAYTVSKHGV